MAIKLPNRPKAADATTPAAAPAQAAAPANTGSALALYEDFDDASLAEAKETADAARESRFIGKFPVGKTVIRMLPARAGVGQKFPWVVLWRHEIDVPGLDWPVKYPCPRMHAKRPCRACQTANQMKAAAASIKNQIDRKVQEERAYKFEPKRKLLANAFKRKEFANGPKLYEFGKTVEAQLISMRDSVDGLGINYTHPVTGSDIIVIRTGDRLETKYTLHQGKQCAVVDDAAEMAEFLSQMCNLQAETMPPSDEEIEEKLKGKAAAGGSASGGRAQRTVASAPKTADGFAEGEIADEDDDLPYQ